MVQVAYYTYFASMKEGMIVLAHSQGGLFALEAARKHAENIRGVIMLESSSDLDVDKVDVSCFRDIPFCFSMEIFWEKSTVSTDINGLGHLPGREA